VAGKTAMGCLLGKSPLSQRPARLHKDQLPSRPVISPAHHIHAGNDPGPPVHTADEPRSTGMTGLLRGVSRETVTCQIDLICTSQLMIVERTPATPNGGSGVDIDGDGPSGRDGAAGPRSSGLRTLPVARRFRYAPRVPADQRRVAAGPGPGLAPGPGPHLPSAARASLACAQSPSSEPGWGGEGQHPAVGRTALTAAIYVFHDCPGWRRLG
jgi:hypothetical protein